MQVSTSVTNKPKSAILPSLKELHTSYSNDRHATIRSMKLFLFLFIFLNLVTFGMFGIDKLLARFNRNRISEKTLLTLAIMGGSVGAVFAQKLFRHKTRKFRYRVWIILVVQFVVFEVLWYFSPILFQTIRSFLV